MAGMKTGAAASAEAQAAPAAAEFPAFPSACCRRAPAAMAGAEARAVDGAGSLNCREQGRHLDSRRSSGL
eukprot:3483269-Lingulodinium_polyedra.AAC.1